MHSILSALVLLTGIALQGWSAEAVSPSLLLTGVEYRVARINDRVLPAAGGPTMMLDATTARVAGSSGVNRYGGGYQLSGNLLTIGQTFSTMMAGEEPAMATEHEFLGIISQPLTATTNADGLLLRSSTGTVVLVTSDQSAK